ncbi:hypothetical protein I79_003527 [Cricetulus griseus]|uniref:Uncharacterized protein n=1 Tax=Cricetulus griseus TaxID=10029 RepID=G3H091_CRIGR|nr:hypothetical protein I79_003527 [Cricetulus griseus]
MIKNWECLHEVQCWPPLEHSFCVLTQEAFPRDFTSNNLVSSESQIILQPQMTSISCSS